MKAFLSGPVVAGWLHTTSPRTAPARCACSSNLASAAVTSVATGLIASFG